MTVPFFDDDRQARVVKVRGVLWRLDGAEATIVAGPTGTTPEMFAHLLACGWDQVGA